jgi:hypothetical protein
MKFKIMKRIWNLSIINVMFLFYLITLFNSCDTEVNPKYLPVLTTTEISNVTEASAQSGGNITSDAGSDVTLRGVCWSSKPNPTIEDNKTSDAAGTGKFTSKLTGLIQSTTYYVRAYAINKKGTVYGIQVTFTTKSLGLTTKPITSITINTAEGGGIIGTDGDSLNVSACGICWNTQSAPTILNSKTINGKDIGEFSSSMTELSLNTKYYVRAYVTNTSGTIYGNEVTFTTQDGIIDLIIKSPTLITPTTVTIEGNITSDGGSVITERGFCISKLPNPNITNKIKNGSGIGSYILNITELTQNTTYYIKTYAINSVGTVYSNEIQFTTLNVISLSTFVASEITFNSATLGGSVLSDGGLDITSRGICYGTSPNPTIESNIKIINGYGLGSFTNLITGLNHETTYYFRSFGTNSNGTVYGSQESFSTLSLGIGYTESFSKSLGLFTTQSVSGAQTWNFSTLGFAVISGFVSPSNYMNEDWLISPKISLIGTTAPKLSFSYVTRYFANPVTEATVMISTNYVSGLPSTATWSILNTSTPFSDLGNWTFINSGAINLSLYSNNKVSIAFKYLSTTAKAGAWEIKNFLVYE